MIFGRKKNKIASNLDAFLNQEKGSSFSAPIPVVSPRVEQAPIQTPASTPEPKKVPASPELKRGESANPFPPQNFSKKQDFRNPEILDLDLIGQESEGKIDGRHYFNLLVAAFLMTAVVVAQIYFMISWWEKNSSTSEDLTKNTARAQKEIKNFQKTADEALDFSKRADLITPLLDNHIYWTNFFRYLERNTLSTVTFEGFTGDNKGEYTLEAKSLHYSDINWQVKKFLADDYTLSATVSEGTSGDKGTGKLSTPISSSTDQSIIDQGKISKTTGPESVNFSIKLKVKPELFLTPKSK